MSKAVHRESGLQLVTNKTTLARNGADYYTCLPDSVSALLSAESKQLVQSSMIVAMLVEGNTLVLNITKALLAHSLSLEPVSRDYIKESGVSFNLLQNATTNW